MGKKDKSNEIHITRVYDAPVAAVWDAWTDPKKAAKWWGPRGFTLTTHSKDLRPGGHWHYTMHGPDGTDYENNTKYFEVEKHALLVYDHGGSKDRPPLFRVTARFSEKNGKTTLRMSMALPTPEAAEETRKFIKKAGGNGTWDRLAEFLEHEATGRERFVINRSFDAPVEVVYDAWAKPEQLAKWLPPTGFTMTVIRGDIRAGSEMFWSMGNGADIVMFGAIRYLELTRPNRLVYTQQFRTEDGKVSRHPKAPTWPETMRTTVTFAEEDGGTRVTVQWEVEGHATPAEIACFRDEKAGMTMGWTGSFDKLEEWLAQR